MEETKQSNGYRGCGKRSTNKKDKFIVYFYHPRNNSIVIETKKYKSLREIGKDINKSEDSMYRYFKKRNGKENMKINIIN